MDKKNEKTKKKVTKKVVVNKKEFKDLNGNVISSATNKKVGLKDNLKKHFKKYKKLYFLITSVIVAIFAIIALTIFIRNCIINRKYSKYEKKMEDYGFSLIYTNQEATSYEKVTKLEVVKMIIASIHNTHDITGRGYVANGSFEDDEWVKYAEANGIISKGYITKENYDDIATYKEALTIYLKARASLMDMPVSNTKESSFKNLQSYTQEERRYINDAAENGLIKDTNKKLTIDKDMFKGEFNMLVVKFVEKYNTIVPEGETLVLKEESKPENSDTYPYILYSVAKEAYEYEGMNQDGVDYKSPVETYKYKKDYYGQVEYRSEIYYNAILNVDYRNINKDSFFKTTDEFLRYDYKKEIEEYVDYVKANKITIQGNAKVQFPIFYLDGIRYRARIKLTFEVKNSSTDKNLLLGDLSRGTDVTYKNKKYEIYIDAPMGTTLLSSSLLLDMEPIIDLIVSDKTASTNNEF